MIAQAYQDKERVTVLVLPAYERKAMRNWVVAQFQINPTTFSKDQGAAVNPAATAGTVAKV